MDPYYKTNDFTSRACKEVPNALNHKRENFCNGCAKLDIYDWLKNITSPEVTQPTDIVEVRFKNSRKDYFKIQSGNFDVLPGDIVAVEANPGHDIGIVSLTGSIVLVQLYKKGINPYKEEFKKLYRKAKPSDIEKWVSAVSLENSTMYKARTIAVNLGLEMKISDVEYQGDKTKAIFYYTAEDRVDFRELIKLLAEEFSVRIEMRQIGVRQEASKLGGIGSCGRELCCSSWLTDFKSVSTNAARVQQLSLNPQKLAGQCSKLKCCLNYEFDCYDEAIKAFPDNTILLKTKAGDAFFQKADIHQKTVWYSYTSEPNVFIPLSIESVKSIIADNKKGVIPAALVAKEVAKPKVVENMDFQTTEGSLTRFDLK